MSSKEQASFNFMAAVSICSDLGAPQNKLSHCFHCFPIYLPRSDGTDLSVLNVEFQANFFTLLFYLQEALLFSFSAIRVVSSADLKLLIFLSAILIPACASSSPPFHVMYSADKQGDKIQPEHTPFPIWNQFFVPCQVLTVIS